MADNNTIARPYAQAAFEVAQESNTLAEFSESFAAAGQLLADEQIVAFLARPSLNDSQRLEFLRKPGEVDAPRLMHGSAQSFA